MSRWGHGNSQTVGRCSLCGGLVTLPAAWWSVVPAEPTCEGCGATAAPPELPTIPMVPPGRATTKLVWSNTSNAAFYQPDRTVEHTFSTGACDFK